GIMAMNSKTKQSRRYVMFARVYVERLTVNQHTRDDDRDEVYFMVGGESPTGQFNKPRIPEPPHTYRGNDYYGLHAGQSAFDSDEIDNPMTLWQGYIEYNQFVRFATVVREQDGAPFVALVLSLPSIVGSVLTGDVRNALTEIGQLAADIVAAA